MIFEKEKIEYQMIKDTVRKFASKIPVEKINRFEETETYPYPFVARLGELGLMGILIPAEYGGAGMDNLAYAIAEEELSRVWAGLGLIMSANNSLSGYPILTYGNEEQKQKYLPALATGKKLGCYALTEPDAGSDPASLKTKAEKQRDIYIINGVKRFITNASKADICIIIARTGTEKHKGLSAFIVETNSPGFQIAKIEKKLGLLCSPTCEIVLENVEIPIENLLGKEGDGFKIVMDTLNCGRINIAAQALGISQGAFELTRDYAKERIQFGQPIAQFQAIQFELAKMAIFIEASRLLTYHAAWLKDQGGPQKEIAKAASTAKYFSTEYGVKIVKEALQIFGGVGYTKDYPIERFLRDIIATTIYEGTSNIQLKIIAKSILE